MQTMLCETHYDNFTVLRSWVTTSGFLKCFHMSVSSLSTDIRLELLAAIEDMDATNATASIIDVPLQIGECPSQNCWSKMTYSLCRLNWRL